MSHQIAVVGVATPDGLFARCGDGWRKLEPTRTPLGLAVEAFCEAWQRGEIEPCPVCGRLDCDMDEWHDIMRCDVAGDLSELLPEDLPY